jgi:hypothetical protein
MKGKPGTVDQNPALRKASFTEVGRLKGRLFWLERYDKNRWQPLLASTGSAP